MDDSSRITADLQLVVLTRWVRLLQDDVFYDEQRSRQITQTTGSAIAAGPRDALNQSKCCQLRHNCAKNRV